MAASRSLPRPLSASTSDHTHCYAKRRNPPLQFCPSVAHCNLAQAPPSHTTHKNFSGFDFPSAPTPRSASTAILDGVGPAGEEARLPRALFFPSKPPRTAQPLLAPWRFFDLKMASLGSRPLLLEALNGADGGAGGGGPVPLQSGLTYGGRSAIFMGNVDIASGGSCWVRFPARRMSSGVSVGAENGKGIRATKKVGNLEGESDDAGDGGDPNSAPAIVDKSRQLLSMQQDFAKQIQFDEKNTRVSLFVSTSAEDKKSSTRFTRAYNVNQVSTESFTNGMHNGSTASSGSVHSTETKTPKTQHVGTPRNSTGETNIHEDSPQAERPSVDAKSATDTTTISSTGLVLPKKEDTEQTVGAKPDHTDSEATASSEDKDVDASPLAGLNVMNVILIAGECAPWSKTGGLGDVAGALPKALARRGHRVMVVAPRYGNYAEPKHIGVSKRYKVGNQDMEVSYYHAYIDGVDFVFIDSPMFSHRENNIYGGDRLEILKRMVLLCKAAVEVPWHVPCGGVCYGDGNLVFIANDWHTALLPVYLKAYYRDIGLMRYTRSVLVIHNIAHQGRGPVEDFNHVDLPEHYVDLFKLFDPIGGEHFNIFAAGLKTADRVVTVSHGYAWELKTSEGGWGLHEIINENDWKLRGIVNGIDTKDWSPELDVHLQSDGYVNYSSDTLQRGKAQCKAALQKELGLPVRAEVPLVGFIGRLDHQKGVDLIAEAVPWIVSQDVQLVMLGTGRPDLEEMLRRFEREHRDKVRGWVGFSVKVAHRITAGADVLLMPSRFEPCGLNQLYAMRYGTVPVVHAVGGLRDTVVPFDPYGETGFGWTFDRAEAGKLIHALGNCFNTYWNYKESWEGLQARGMAQDLSWDNAAKNYEEVLLAAKYQW